MPEDRRGSSPEPVDDYSGLTPPLSSVARRGGNDAHDESAAAHHPGMADLVHPRRRARAGALSGRISHAPLRTLAKARRGRAPVAGRSRCRRPRTVEFVAELCDVQVASYRGHPKTERLLALTTDSTRDEGLWEKYDRQVKTLYVLRRRRVLAQPFPIPQLVKVSHGERLSPEYHYNYVLVVPVGA
jgi:hypothetical protein